MSPSAISETAVTAANECNRWYTSGTVTVTNAVAITGDHDQVTAAFELTTPKSLHPAAVTISDGASTTVLQLN